MLLFSTQLWDLHSPVLLLFSSLWFNSPPFPLPCVNKYTLYTHTVWRGEEVWGSWPPTDNHRPQSPFTDQFFRWLHIALVSISLISSWANPNKQTRHFFTLKVKSSDVSWKVFEKKICLYNACDYFLMRMIWTLKETREKKDSWNWANKGKRFGLEDRKNLQK